MILTCHYTIIAMKHNGLLALVAGIIINFMFVQVVKIVHA